MKTVLVTGGLGFIGSHTVVELQNSGYHVIIMDNLSNSSIEVLDNINNITGTLPDFYNIDLRVKNDLIPFFKEHSIDGIIHFAAFKAVGESMQKPLAYYENNVGGLVNLLQEAQKYAITNFIFSSSCTVYGQADRLPITEDAPIKRAESPYGYTKQIGEKIVEESCKVTDLRAISLRYFNPIGAHDSALIGELPKGTPQNLVPFITQTAAGVRDELSVFGNDYPTPDGTAIRDYIHVVDLAKAHISALERLLNRKNTSNYEIFNIGTGKGSSVLEVIRTFENISGVRLNYKIIARREGDITAAYADTSLANDILGWKAERTLDDALSSAWIWQKKQ